MPQKVLIIGGLGFIGSHISQVLTENDLKVTVAQRSTLSTSESTYPLIHLDLASIPVVDLVELLKGFRYVIFCGGADDRTMPIGDAAAFFYRENVAPCVKLAEASSIAGVKKMVILGSYFTHFDREVPAWNLAATHPYIQSRQLQQKESAETAHNGLQVSTLEIPYVFGAAPGKTPLWKPLIDYVRLSPLVFYPKGGTNIMSVQQVAQAVLGVLNASTYRPHWIVGSENVSWTQLIQMIATALGKRRRVVLLPTALVRFFARLAKLYLRLSKKQMGLDLVHYIDVQTSNTFLDVEESMRALGYGPADMQGAIEETVRASGGSA